MAREVARVLPVGARVLDVGCGNGFIAHHLVALLGARVVGIDVAHEASARIDYLRYDGRHFPLPDQSFDAALLCYVLHHAQDLGAVLNEVQRSLRDAGLVVVYEDMPDSLWDRFMCRTHDLMWRSRTGRCNFRRANEWRTLFNSLGFEIVVERQLSRWRNLAYPVRHRLYVLKAREPHRLSPSPTVAARQRLASHPTTLQASEA